MIVRELITLLSFKTDEATLRRAEQRVQAVANKLGDVGRKMTTFVTLPILAVGAGMVKVASDFVEVNQKFDVVFQDIQEEARKTSETLQKEFFLSQKTTEELLSSTGDLLTGFGFTGAEALDMAKSVLSLGSDLASFTNVQGGAAEAVDRFNSGIVGNIRGLRMMGIVIRQDTDAFRSRVATLQTERSITVQQAKALAIMEESYKQSQNAIGDVQRTQDSLANQMRFFKEDIIQLSTVFGKLLIPIVSKATLFLRGIAKSLTGLSEETQKTILIVGAVVAAIGPLLLISAVLIKTLLFIRGAFATAAIASARFQLSMLWIPLLVAAAIAALVLFIDDLTTWVKGGDSLIGDALGSWVDFKDKILGYWDEIKSAMGGGLWEALMLDAKDVSSFLKTWFTDVWDDITDAMGKDLWEALKLDTIDALNSIKTWFIEMWNDITKKLTPDFGGLKKLFGFGTRGNEESISGGGIKNVVEQADQFLNPYIVPGSPSLAVPGAGLGSQSININSNIDIAFPQGTTEEHRAIVEKDVRGVMQKEFSKQISSIVRNNPVDE